MMNSATYRERSLKQREKRLILILVLIVVGMIASYCLIILPQAWAYVRKVQTISADTVKTMIITRIQRVEAKNMEESLSLPKTQIPVLLKLVAEAESYSPDHPNFNHKFHIQIITTTGVIEFVVLPTKNNGTLISINSNGTDGWDYGTLRNDELKLLIDAMPFKEY